MGLMKILEDRNGGFHTLLRAGAGPKVTGRPSLPPLMMISGSTHMHSYTTTHIPAQANTCMHKGTHTHAHTHSCTCTPSMITFPWNTDGLVDLMVIRENALTLLSLEGECGVTISEGVFFPIVPQTHQKSQPKTECPVKGFLGRPTVLAPPPRIALKASVESAQKPAARRNQAQVLAQCEDHWSTQERPGQAGKALMFSLKCWKEPKGAAGLPTLPTSHLSILSL